MEKLSNQENQKKLIGSWLIVAISFGAVAFLVRWAGLFIPVIGTRINSDPREIFIVLGSALTGPVGGLLIGLLGGVASLIKDVGLTDLLGHMIGGLLMGLLYKWAYRRWRMPILFIAWVSLVIGYYFSISFVFVSGLFLFYPGNVPIMFGVDLPFFQVFRLLVQVALPEMAITIIVTSIILVALPPKYRRPLW